MNNVTMISENGWSTVTYRIINKLSCAVCTLLVLLSKFKQEGKFSNKKAVSCNKCKSLFTRISISIHTAPSTYSGLDRVTCTGNYSSTIQWQEGANEGMEEVGQLTNDKKECRGMPNEED